VRAADSLDPRVGNRPGLIRSIRRVIAEAVRTVVARSDDEPAFLVPDIGQSLGLAIAMPPRRPHQLADRCRTRTSEGASPGRFSSDVRRPIVSSQSSFA
jgi:hypothetical protein